MIISIMKFKVPKSTLDKAIKSVSKAVPSKGIQPILKNILLETNEGYLKLNATDLDFTIEATIPSINEVSGSITISAQKLEEVVSKLDDDDIYITVDRLTNKANLLCKESNFDLVGLPSEDFPKQDKPELAAFISINKAEFSRIINLVHFSSSKYDLNNILGGIYLGISEIKEDGDVKYFLEIASTDGNRLSSYQLELKGLESFPKFSSKEAVVPARVITDVQKILDTSVDDTIKISFIDRQIVFATEDRFIVSRLLDGTYPRYKQLIPSNQDKIAQINRKDLLTVLERVAVMANEITNLVKLSFAENLLTIESKNQDFGKADDKVTIEYIGEPLEIYFNVKYLTEPLKYIDSEKIQIALTSSVNPVLIRPISQENYIHLVMPIKHEG